MHYIPEPSLRALLVQEMLKNKENAIYYLSRTLLGPKEQYSPIEDVCGANIHHKNTMTLPATLFDKAYLKDGSPHIYPKSVDSRWSIGKWALLLW